MSCPPPTSSLDGAVTAEACTHGHNGEKGRPLFGLHHPSMAEECEFENSHDSVLPRAPPSFLDIHHNHHNELAFSLVIYAPRPLSLLAVTMLLADTHHNHH